MRGSAFDEFEFQAERGPVLEELRRDHDDPWWRLHEALEATAYHVHPYRNPVIGWAEELIRVPRQDVLDFYEAWYRPNNCTLVLAGALDVEQAIEEVATLFGPIEAAPLPEPIIPVEPAQEGERRFELELEVTVPRMAAAFHSVAVRHDDDPVLDVLQIVLSSGKASRLYDRMVRRDRLVTEVQCWNDTRRDPGLFEFFLEVQDGVDHTRAEAVLWEEVARVLDEPIGEEELARAKTMLRADLLFKRATSSGLAEGLGSYALLAGDWNGFLDLPERVAAVTAADVQRVAKTYLRRSNRTVGWALPRPSDALAPPPLPGDAVHADLGTPPAETRGEPAILSRVPARLPSIRLDAHRVVLPNGLRVILQPRRDVPILSARVLLDAGQLREAHAGTAALLGVTLAEGTCDRSGTDIARFFESRGARFGAGSTGAALRCLIEDADPCLGLLRDVLLRPSLPQDAVDRKRGELLSQLSAEADDPALIGRLRLNKEIYGAHPYARPAKGSADALKALDRDQLLRHHTRHCVPRNGIVALVGDFDRDAMEATVRELFGSWEDRPIDFPTFEAPPESAASRCIKLTEDREQVHVYLGQLGIRRDDPDYEALLVGDLILGSGPGFTDRLSGSLRDEQGLAYTVWARIAQSADREPGTFAAYIGTSPAMWERAEAGIRSEITRFVNGPITEREVADAKAYLLGSYVFGFETAQATVEQIAQLERLGLGLDYPERYLERVAALDVETVSAAVRRHIDPDRLLTVAVGRV